MGGTGAGIISYLIDSASKGGRVGDKPPLTYYGSSHLIWPRFLIPFCEVQMPVEEQINALLTNNFDFNFGEPKKYSTPTYYAFHCTNLDIAMENCKNKCILITYTQDDAFDIAKTFLGKRHIDGFYYPDGQRFYVEKDNLIELKNEYYKQLDMIVKYQPSFVPRYDYGDRLLNLSWNELINDDPNKVIKKISEFTNLDLEKFDTETFSEWQKRTHFCLVDLEPLVQQLMKEYNE